MSEALDHGILDEIDELFSSFHRSGAAPDMVHGIVADGEVLHTIGQSVDGDRSPRLNGDSVFRIASMTKSFTAAAVLLLRDEGALTLDAPVATYVPEAAAIAPATSDAPDLTLRMLLTMSAGFANDDPWADREESLPPSAFSALVLGGFQFSSTPGTRFEYSNLGYAIVGRAVANVSGRSYLDFVRSRLLDPLSMLSTHFAVHDVDPARLVTGHRRFDDAWQSVPFDGPGAFSPIGGLFSSVNDLARWVGGFSEAFSARDVVGDGHPLSRASRREMQQLQRFVGVRAITPPSQPPAEPSSEMSSEPSAEPPSLPSRPAARAGGYGLGLAIEHDSRWGSIVGHSGGYPGYGSDMRWHPTSGFGVVALGNARYVSMRLPAIGALDLILAAISAPPQHSDPWPETIEMQSHVQRLLLDWDDELADSIFSSNVDLDLPRDRRRAEVGDVIAALGQLAGITVGPTTSLSGAHAAWSISGAAGRADVEIWLTPHMRPLLHTMTLQLVRNAG